MLGPTCPIKYFTMYKLNFSHKLGPICLLLLLYARDRGRGNQFSIPYDQSTILKYTLNLIDNLIFITMYKFTLRKVIYNLR